MLLGGLLGLVVGAVLGLTGAGGGIFAVPALVFGLGLEIRSAAPIALLAVGAAAGLGAIHGLRQGIVRYKAATVLASAGAVTAPIGIKLAHALPAQWLNLTFVAIMLIVAYRMFSASRSATNNGELTPVRTGICNVSEETGRFVWRPRTMMTMAGIGAVSGLFTGMLGVGGGFIIVPALAYFSNLRIHSIVATSLLVIALLSAISVFMTFRFHDSFLLTAPTLSFALCALVGMAAARRLSPKISSALLQRTFSIACLIVAIMMLVRPVG